MLLYLESLAYKEEGDLMSKLVIDDDRMIEDWIYLDLQVTRDAVWDIINDRRSHCTIDDQYFDPFKRLNLRHLREKKFWIVCEGNSGYQYGMDEDRDWVIKYKPALRQVDDGSKRWVSVVTKLTKDNFRYILYSHPDMAECVCALVI